MDGAIRKLYFPIMPPRLRPGGIATDRGDVPAFFLYGEPLRAPDARTVHVETIAARSRLYDWKIRAHRHRDLHQVLIVWRGPIEAQLDGAKQILRGPAFVIVPALTVHSFQFGKQTDGLVVTFAAGLAREIFRDSNGLGEILDRPAAARFRRTQLAATDLPQLATMLLRESARAATGRDSALHGLLTTLLTNVLRISEGTAAPAPSAANREREMVARFREAVERRYRGHLGVGDYAREIGTSEAALRKACVRVAGQSPTQLIHARMLIEAERQLRYTGMSITQIAYYLGFEDPAYFSRFFTKGIGASPRSVRRGAGTT
jgi:AraC family transcriptional regulator, transcriptional activator of pobA